MRHRKGSIVTVPVGQDDPIRCRAKVISGPHRLTDEERANLFDNFGIRAATYYRVGIGSLRSAISYLLAKG